MSGTKINRFLPNNEYQAAISAAAPTALNPFATIADVGGATQNLQQVLDVASVASITSSLEVDVNDEYIWLKANNTVDGDSGFILIDSGLGGGFGKSISMQWNDPAANARGFGASDTQMLFYDTISSKGAVYAADYSVAGIADPRWIPDYGAVTAAITASVGSYLPLAGETMTGDISITSGVLVKAVTGEANLLIGTNTWQIDNKTGINAYTESWVYGDSFAAGIGYGNGDKTDIYTSSTAITLSNHVDSTSILMGLGIIQIEDSVTLKGAVYAANYDTKGILDPDWIPSYRAVEAAIAASTSPSIYTGSGSLSVATTVTMTTNTLTFSGNQTTFQGLNDLVGTNSLVTQNASAQKTLQVRNNGSMVLGRDIGGTLDAHFNFKALSTASTFVSIEDENGNNYYSLDPYIMHIHSNQNYSRLLMGTTSRSSSLTQLWAAYDGQYHFSFSDGTTARHEFVTSGTLAGSVQLNRGNATGATVRIGGGNLANTVSPEIFDVRGSANENYLNVLRSNGNVGIGILTPLEKLHVVGNLRVQGGSTYNYGAGEVTTNTVYGSGALISNTTGLRNTAMGEASLASNTIGDRNTAFGSKTLQTNISGINNTAVGASSLASSTGNYSTAVGAESMLGANTGTDNSALGAQSLKANTSGYENVAIGSRALIVNTIGFSNTAVGYVAMGLNVGGDKNVAVGRATLYSNTSNNNTALGFQFSFLNTSGSDNTSVGFESLYTNVTGLRNVTLGSNSGRFYLGSDKLFIDNQSRTNAATELTSSLIVGTFSATVADQRLTINANVGIGGNATSTSTLSVTGLPTVVTGLVAGDIWSNAGVLTIV